MIFLFEELDVVLGRVRGMGSCRLVFFETLGPLVSRLIDSGSKFERTDKVFDLVSVNFIWLVLSGGYLFGLGWVYDLSFDLEDVNDGRRRGRGLVYVVSGGD